MSKQFWGVIIAIVLVFVGVIAFSGNKNNSSSNGTGTLTNHVEGSTSTGVKLVEYGDYQCPFCGEYYSVVKQMAADFNDKIQFQFRNFPLVNNHPNAFAGARAAEAAALQNKFWEMHDKLYEENVIYNQAQQQGQTYNTWINASDPSSYFIQYAQGLGLNVTQFKTDYASSKVNDLINADMAEGNKLKINGTPTFFLDGTQVNLNKVIDSSGLPVLSKFEALVNAEIAKKAKTASTTSTNTSSSTSIQ